jgi:hypothetical protein
MVDFKTWVEVEVVDNELGIEEPASVEPDVTIEDCTEVVREPEELDALVALDPDELNEALVKAQICCASCCVSSAELV